MVELLGFLITMDGIKASYKILEGIKKFPRPDSLTDTRSLHGLVAQVMFTFNKLDVMAPFRLLLNKGNKHFQVDKGIKRWL